MATRKPPPPHQNAILTVQDIRAAVPKLERRIADLEAFDVAAIRDRSHPEADILVKKINSTLRDIVGVDTVEYMEYSVGSFDTLPLHLGSYASYSPKQIQEGYKQGIKRAVLKLQTLRDLFAERAGDIAASHTPSAPSPVARSRSPNGRKVFVVHGHDDGAKETVARFLTKLELEPVILHEQPNRGRTVIEKFEAHSEGVAFAVALFTPDDVGYAAGHDADAKSRARQNVVLELGFFMAALGRERVCVLYKSGVEVPSDYAGVLYQPMDDGGAWRFMLAKEIKAAGIEVDLNKAA